MPGAVEKLVSELGFFFEPLGNSLESGADLGRFVRNFGVDIDGLALDNAVQAFGPLSQGIFDLIALSGKLVEDGFQKSDLETVKTAAEPIFDIVSDIGNPFSGTVPQGMTAQEWAATLQSLPEELINFLLTIYLRRRLPMGLQVLTLVDVYAPQQVPATGDPRSRGLAYRREIYNWDRIAQLFRDPGTWAREAYGWGGDFQTEKAVSRLTETIEFLGGSAERDHMTEAQVAAFMPHLVGAPIPPLAAFAPLWSHIDEVNGELDPATHAEVGLMILPAANAANTEQGLALGPYAKGSASADIDLGDGMRLGLGGSFGAAGGAVFRLLPSAMTLERGIEATALESEFDAELVIRDPQGDPLILIGEAGSTRVQIDSALAKLGGEASNAGFDFHLAAGVEALKLVVDASEDGLLGSVLSGELELDAGDLLLGWRYSTGLYFEGGTSLGVTIPLDATIGPVNLYELGVELDWAEDPTIAVTVTADITLGPLFAYADGLGLSVAVVPRDGGLIGNTHDLDFGFIAPNSYAVSLDADPITGGGMLDRRDNEYRGALALQLSSIGMSAFAILNTRLPDDQDGISFAGSIFVEFSVPLGFGFFLTGVGGFLGINRTIYTDAMRDVLYEGRLDNLLFPADPIQNAATILEDMAEILPAREGQYLFGPVARISFSQPALADITAGLVLEIGRDYRLLILGGVAVNLPTRESALVALNLSFFGEIDFSAETISIDATLQGSRVLTFPISGDIAVRSGWGPRQEHIASFGGLHPLFPKPGNLPDLRRLSIGFGTNNPRVTLSSYIATTNNSLQFGARADAYFRGPKIWLVGRLAAEGWLYFDALIYFDPFSFDVRLGGGIRLLVDGKTKAELGFDLRLRGPNTFRFNGKVWITIFGIDVDFGVDHTWGSRKSIPPPTVDGVAVLHQALEAAQGLEAVPPTGRVPGVSFAETDDPRVDPFGGVQLTQSAVPLAVAIEKIGEARVPQNANLLDITVRRRNGTIVQASPVNRDFVRGHFFAISDSERLSATAFDSHKCGFGFDAQSLIGPADKAVTEDYGYEYIEIPIDEDSNIPAGITGLKAINAGFARKFMGIRAIEQAARINDLKPRFIPDKPVSVNRSVFVATTAGAEVAAADLGAAASPQDKLIADALAEETLTMAAKGAQTQAFLPDGEMAANPVVADYVALAATM